MKVRPEDVVFNPETQGVTRFGLIQLHGPGVARLKNDECLIFRVTTFGHPATKPSCVERDGLEVPFDEWVTERLREQDFMDELVALCEKHRMSLSHEDNQGAFIIEEFSQSNIQWLKDAHFKTPKP